MPDVLSGSLLGREWISLRKSLLVPIRIGRDDPAGLIQALNLIGCQGPANGSEIFRQLRFVARADDEARDGGTFQPMAARLAPGDYDQLHHFIADGVWDAAPLESELLVQADRLVGGKDAVLVIDDTAMPKKGDRSVGVAPQYASS
jgi:hypothetical protein